MSNAHLSGCVFSLWELRYRFKVLFIHEVSFFFVFVSAAVSLENGIIVEIGIHHFVNAAKRHTSFADSS